MSEESESRHGPFKETPLNAAEARILGCLIEKQATTPEAYPLTVNSLVLACNQKTSREPVMNLESGQVGQALRKLENRGLTRLVMGARADRWEHRVDKALELVPAQLTLLGLLLLRGPQTLGELLTRSSRMHRFEDMDQLKHHVGRLVARGQAMQLPRLAGQREERFMHLLAGEVEPEAAVRDAGVSNAVEQLRGEPQSPELRERIEKLEVRVAALEEKLEGGS